MKALSLLLILFPLLSWAKLPTVENLLAESMTVDWENAVSESIIIRAPIEEVWKYASDSTKAVEWSVYFDHISPIPSAIPDGRVGSLRRCFRNKDESGLAWDEVTIEAVPLKSRKIVTYNFQNYPWRIIHKNEYAFVRQLYRAIDSQTTEMTFQTMARPRSSFLWKKVFWQSSSETGEIFHYNLENIKAAIEGYPRVYPWR